MKKLPRISAGVVLRANLVRCIIYASVIEIRPKVQAEAQAACSPKILERCDLSCIDQREASSA